jgi:peptidyl-dipeptidase Dcp
MLRFAEYVVLSAAVLSAVLTACSRNSDSSAIKPNNPFLAPSTLPYQAPPFDKIQDGDFMPAFAEAMKQKLSEIRQIADNPEPSTLNNTLIELEKCGQMLTRVQLTFNALTGANTDSVLQEMQEIVAPELAAIDDALYLNEKLFQRIKTLYNDKDQLVLDAESSRLLEYYYLQFIHAGANLSVADKSRLMKLNKEEASLSAKFENQLLEGTKAAALIISDSLQLAGLTAGDVQAAVEAAKSRKLDRKWVLPLQNTTQQPLLQSLENRSIREKLFQASWNRTESGDANDTRAVIQRLAQIRAEKAQLLGFQNYAAWKLEDQMAKNPAAVHSFLGKLIPATVAKARQEAADIQSLMKKAGTDQLQPWDWRYFADKVRKARFDLDESQIKPYFELDNVLQNGIFYAAHELYGINFQERRDLPVYHPDVRVFELFDKDNSPLGLFYADYFKRDNKSGGAWMDNFVLQSKLLGTKPVIYNVLNITKPAQGQPALLSYDEVTTLFHEFGHALHGFFADQQFPTLSGTNVARDFVELPSQFNEHWALYPQVLKNYAKHFRTGEPMPKELVDKIKKSDTFNQGYMLTELVEAADLDMAWHTLQADTAEQNVDAFELLSLKKDSLYIAQVPPRYRSSYFMHIWSNGYAAGYYAYLWCEMLDNDAFQWFLEHGGLTRENGQHFRDAILSRGNTGDYEKMYESFSGRKPDISPMLKKRGLE